MDMTNAWKTWTHWAIVLAVSAWTVCGLSGAAIAQMTTEQATLRANSDAAKPWEVSADQSQQTMATELYRQGNQMLRQERYGEALAKYREALAHWDHPRIHYHVALALVQLGDDPVAAYDSVEQALRYDGKALKPDQLERARDYKLLLRRQLVQIEVSSEQADVEVKFDGKVLVLGPGTAKRLVTPGTYQITASKRGYLTVNRSILLLPGQDKQVALALFTLDDLTVSRRYWQPWKPWATAGAGAALVALGGVLHWRAKVNIDSFDDALLQDPDCLDGGCLDDGDSARSALLDRGRLQQDAALASYIIGGTVLSAGLVLTVLNRPRSYRVDKGKESFRISVAPTVSPHGTTLVAKFRF